MDNSTAETTAKPDHLLWCENELPEPIVRLSKNPVETGIYETDYSSADDLDIAIIGALEGTIKTLKEALVDGVSENEYKIRLAISQLLQIDVDVNNILFVHEEGMTDEERMRRKCHLRMMRDKAEGKQ